MYVPPFVAISVLRDEALDHEVKGFASSAEALNYLRFESYERSDIVRCIVVDTASEEAVHDFGVSHPGLTK